MTTGNTTFFEGTFIVIGPNRHRQVLLRGEADGHRVDMVFSHVTSLSLPTELEQPSVSQLREGVWSIHHRGGVGEIHAGSFRSIQDQGPLWGPSYLYVSTPFWSAGDFVAPEGRASEQVIAESLRDLLRLWSNHDVGARYVMEQAERMVYHGNLESLADDDPVGICLSDLSSLHTAPFLHEDIPHFLQLLDSDLPAADRVQRFEAYADTIDFAARTRALSEDPFYGSGALAGGSMKKTAYDNTWTDVLVADDATLAQIMESGGAANETFLREVLQSVSGGRPEKACFITDEVEVSIGYILLIHPGVRTDIRRGMKHVAGHGLFPFAIDAGNSSYYCVRVADGSVVYFYMDEDPRYGVQIADSAKQFIEGLVECPY